MPEECHLNLKRLSILTSLVAASLLMFSLEIIGLAGVSRRRIILMMAREYEDGRVLLILIMAKSVFKKCNVAILVATERSQY